MRQAVLAGSALTTALLLAAPGPAASAAGPRTERIGVDQGGESYTSANPSISRHGRVVAYEAYVTTDEPCTDPYYPCPPTLAVVAYDRATRRTESISSPPGAEENGSSQEPSISRDGRFVAFRSSSTNLVPGEANGKYANVFVRDRATGAIEQIPDRGFYHRTAEFATDPSMSANGRYVAFTSWDQSQNTWIHVHDRETGVTEWVGGGLRPSISPDGRYVAFQTHNLEAADESTVEAVDRKTDERVIASIDHRGRFVLFAGDPAISAGGRFVAFWSSKNGVVPGDRSYKGDIFVRDLREGTTRLVSADPQGAPGNEDSLGGTAISASGRYVSFVSSASNLVAHDTNGLEDVFVRDLKRSRTRRASISTARVQGNRASGILYAFRCCDAFHSAISGDGRFVAFHSYATNLASPRSEPSLDVFVRGPLHP